MSFPSSPCQIVANPRCSVKETDLILSCGLKIQGELSFGSRKCWLNLCQGLISLDSDSESVLCD